MWLVSLAACSSGPCSDLGAVATGIGQVEARLRIQLAAVGVAEECALPDPVEEKLRMVGNLAPNQIGVADLAVAAELPELWTAACPAGTGVLAEAMKLSPADRRKRVYEACGLQGKGISEAYVTGNGLLVLPVLVHHLLAEENAFERSMVVDALAGG